jgi:hypothetical protein
MGACVSSSPATSADALEGSRAPTNTPEAKSSAPPKPSDGLTARTPATVDRTPPAETPHAGTLPAPPRVDRRSTPGTALVVRVRQRAESLEREEQFQFSSISPLGTNGDTTAEGVAPTPSPTRSPLDRLYSCGLASPDPLSPHPLSPDFPSESEGEGPREEDEEARNDEKENDDDATPLRKGRTLVRASTPEGERVVVSPALKRVSET